MKRYRILICLLAVFIGLLVPGKINAADKCKELGVLALKETGGSDNLKKMTDDAYYFGALSYSDRENVKEIFYARDDNSVYSIAVIKAKSVKKSKAVLKSLKSYKKNNISSDYFGDYSAAEQSVLKNAVCKRKGKYVWYIAMSTSKAANKRGQSAIIEALI